MNENTDVHSVLTTMEVADNLEMSIQYTLKLAKKMLEEKKLTETEFRHAGKRTCLFNIAAQEKIRKELSLSPKERRITSE